MVVVAAGGYWFLGRADGATDAQAIVATATSGTQQTTVSGSGTLAPARQADLDFEVSGRVTKVEVKAGDTVKKGDVLAELDTVSLDAALGSAKAQLEAAQTTVANDGSESAVQRASHDAALASAQADADQAEDDLDAATLRATFSGTVASVDLAVGDQAGSSSSSPSATGGAGSTDTGTGAAESSTTTAAVTVVKPQTFVVDADVSADDITQVKKGLQVQITPADAAEPIFGTVTEVGLVAETSTAGAATFPVTVSITGKQNGLYVGTSADVSIIVKQVEDVLTVPSQALSTSGSKTYVQKVAGSSTKKTAVTVGDTYGASTEITKGIAAGDKVEITMPTRARTSGSSSGGGQQRPGGGGFPGGGMPAGGFPGGGPE